MSLNNIGDSKTLKKNGYYYTEKYVKTHPYYRNEYGGYSNDSTTIINQVTINTLSLSEDGSAIKLGTYSGMQNNSAYNYGIKCNLEDSNTLESAFEHFECYLKEFKNRNLKFPYSKVEIWNQGVYKIENSSITIQIFYNSLGDYNLYEEKGIIINDSTFILTNALDYQTGEKYEIEKVYKFKKMENFPKIDNYILKNKKRFNKN